MKYRNSLPGQQNPWIISGCQEGIQGSFAIKEIVFFLGQLLLALPETACWTGLTLLAEYQKTLFWMCVNLVKLLFTRTNARGFQVFAGS